MTVTYAPRATSDAPDAPGPVARAQLALEAELDACMADGQFGEAASLRRLRAKVDAALAAVEAAGARETVG